MDLDELMKKKVPELIPFDNEKVNYVSFEEKNDILVSPSMHYEMGYRRYGYNYYVAMYCPMKGIDEEMLRWWFWWHPQKRERYEAWFPLAHKNISYDKKDAKYFEDGSLPSFQDNTQYPRETIGGQTMTLRIDFLLPSEFGFDEKTMKENGIAEIICGNVGVKGISMHTKMAHIAKKTDEGILLISRFWMGELLKDGLLKKIFLKEKMAQGMAEHCYVEYRNLAEILPSLYKEYGPKR